MTQAKESWTVELFPEGEPGGPVRRTLERLPADDRARIVRRLNQLRAEGPIVMQELGLASKVRSSGEGLWELRVPGAPQYRALFLWVNRRLLVVHLFAKKKQVLDKQEIETADRRAGQVDRSG